MSHHALLFDYEPPGPVAEAFIHSTAPVALIMGPVGSGKTTALVFKIARFAALMPPSQDGVRRTKVRVIRESFRNLEKTFLPSWLRFFPKEVFPDYEGGIDRPITHRIVLNLEGRGRIELTVEMIGLGDHRIEDVMRGWEGSLVVVNESDQVLFAVFGFGAQRTGRYPRTYHHADPTSLPPNVEPLAQVIGDTNPPDVDHDIYKNFVEKPLDGHVLFKQPGGLSPKAENLKNLPGGRRYYERIMLGQPDWWVRRFIHGEFGYSRYGTPVFPMFNDDFIARNPLEPDPDLRLYYLGMDGGGGLRPAGVFVQRNTMTGQVRVIDECVPGHGVGPGRFAEHMLDIMTPRWDAIQFGRAWADPQGLHGADRAAGQATWFETVGAGLGVQVEPGVSQEIGFRVDSVTELLIVRDKTPMLLVSPTCKILIAGFMSKYCYTEQIAASRIGTRRSLVPEKNEWSDVQDGLQYVVTGLRGRSGAIRELARGHRPVFERVATATRARIGRFRF